MRILIVEDDRRIANVLKKGLSEEGYAIDLAYDGFEGQFLGESEDYDLIILDLMLPKVDGMTVCKNLRKKQIKTPILILTAKTAIEDRVEGLNIGADDYLTKPFSFRELTARINALLRRSQETLPPTLKASDLELDPIKHIVAKSGKKIDLSAKEFAILEYLLRHKNQAVTRTMILEHVWDYNFDPASNIVDVFMNHLRKKVDESQEKSLIQTIHGVGFKLSDE
jgi:DNA-binding response OmpR family regulator